MSIDYVYTIALHMLRLEPYNSSHDFEVNNATSVRKENNLTILHSTTTTLHSIHSESLHTLTEIHK
jgi:hypothetical protein